MRRFTWALPCRLDGWLLRLADGWRLPWIVGPMAGPHGSYSVLLERNDEPRGGGATGCLPRAETLMDRQPQPIEADYV